MTGLALSLANEENDVDDAACGLLDCSGVPVGVDGRRAGFCDSQWNSVGEIG